MKCKKGHTLSGVYYFLKNPHTMRTINGFGYCVKCNKLFEIEEWKGQIKTNKRG